MNIYIITESSCADCGLDYTHQNLFAFTRYDDAMEHFERIQKEVEDKTSQYFTDSEIGWINPEREPDDYFWGKDFVCYTWKHPETGEVNHTKFRLETMEVS